MQKTTRDEVKGALQEQQERPGKIQIDKYEAYIISSAVFALTAGLIAGRLSEVAYVGLLGTFFGYTFGRIFNHVQGKE